MGVSKLFFISEKRPAASEKSVKVSLLQKSAAASQLSPFPPSSNSASLQQRAPQAAELEMEEELRCPLCRRFFTKPVLMPCSHSLCVACALSSQEPAQNLLPHGALLGGSASGGCNGGSDADSGTVLSDRASSSSSSSTNLLLDFPDIDKLSIVSETDSGVICNSRPSSYVGTSSVANIFLQSLQSCTYGIKCSVCERLVFLDENGALSLPTNRVLEAIVQKYQKQMAANGGTLSGRNKVEIKCERCLSSDKRAATSMCEQCEVFFCDICRSQCHDPAQDPSLAGHNLVDPAQGDVILRYKRKNSREHKCPEHTRETLTMFCVSCRLPVCGPCAQEGRHMTHDVQMLPAMCKSQKVS
ncbi:E3 ubiquitin-protein ligase TRIM9 [Elysia marginata]|uniref:E3 ubiquitin-protein ligase TRIM9 n=1 Tax=Elysia marginata TaxID=1093978 RepID=A0AAV4FDJ2_9GAST|nr:E3 ubiquitin-protein ligase TRIM9 [Elysia marginata]